MAVPYLKPTRSSICCTLIWFMPTALMGSTSLLKLPPVMALRAGLSKLQTFDHGPLVVAVGKVVLCFGADQVFQKLHGVRLGFWRNAPPRHRPRSHACPSFVGWETPRPRARSPLCRQGWWSASGAPNNRCWSRQCRTRPLATALIWSVSPPLGARAMLSTMPLSQASVAAGPRCSVIAPNRLRL